MSKLAYKFLYNPRVQELQRAIKESEVELKKLKGMTDEEALRLQSVSLERESTLKEIHELKEKKAKLSLLEEKLKGNVKESKAELENIADSKSSIRKSFDEQTQQEKRGIKEKMTVLGEKEKKVKAELEAKVDETVSKLQSIESSSKAELHNLEARKVALKERIKVLEENEQEYQDKIKILLEAETKRIEGYKLTNDKEIENLLGRKNQMEREAIDLSKRLSEGLTTTREKSAKKVVEYKQELKGIDLELNTLKGKKEHFEGELQQVVLKNEDLALRNKTLEENILKAKEQLIVEEGKERKVLEAIKKEEEKEKIRLKSITDNIEKLTLKIEELEPVADELGKFVFEQAKARTEYLKERTRLDAVLSKKDATLKEVKEKSEFILKEKNELDATKEYMKSFYGKIATYVKFAKETIEDINEELKGKVPLRFETPPDIEEVKFNNFNKKYKI